MIGKKFGKLTVIAEAARNKWKQKMVLCECDCGNEKVVLASALKSKHTKSCGCLSRGVSKLSEYNSWVHIKSRCCRPSNKAYERYGGRGITVCTRWKNSFEDFFTDMGKRPSKNHSIDRINNDGNYCKSNCRWATDKEQSRNTRRNKIIKYRGKSMCLAEAVEKHSNLNYMTVLARFNNYGWSIKDALEKPLQAGGRYGN